MFSFRCFLLISAAIPQGIAQTETLQSLVVEADRLPPPSTLPTLNDSREEVLKTPGGVEVVDPERYLRGRASTMADTFSLSPGVIAQPRFGSDEARLSIRGSGMQRTFHGRGIRLLQDGIPLNLADGSFDMQAVDPLAADHITILRGANALSKGASTLGGAIHYISSTGRTAPGGSLRLEGGSFEYLRARLEAGLHEGNRDAYFSLSAQSQDGFRDHSKQEGQRFFSNMGWRINDGVETRLFVSAVNSRSQLPGSLTKVELEDDPLRADESLFGALRFDHRRDFELLRVANKTVIVDGSRRIEFIAAFSYKDLDHPITPFVGVLDQLSKDGMIGVNFTQQGEFQGRENQFRAGMTFTQGELIAATYQNVLGDRGALRSQADQTASNMEVFVENELCLGRGFTGVIGSSAAWNWRENDQNFGSAPSYDRSYDGVSPKVGLRWETGGIQLFGNVSGSYEPPSFSETNGALTPNKAQTATTVEIGTRGAHANIRWDIAFYSARISDEFLALSSTTGVPLGTTNADRTVHQGVELFGEVDLLGASWEASPEDRLLLRGAWTYGRFKFDDDEVYEDNTIAGLPPHLIRAELIWEMTSGYYAGPTFEWVPTEAFVDHANTLSADPYALLGFKFGRRVERGLSWFIEAKNLTDERYAATTGVLANAGPSPQQNSRNFLPGDGRGVYAGVEWQW